MMMSEIDMSCIRSSYSGSSGSNGGSGVDVPVRNGVDVPVRNGVDVPEALGVAGVLGIFGTIVRMENDTSPVAVATGFAEFPILWVSIEVVNLGMNLIAIRKILVSE